MYKNNFAAAIKVNGKILREFGDTVYLPFGSEYQIRLKNLSFNRSKVKIEIDGENVTDSGLVLNAQETFDLERFIRNENLSEGNRFKFIERTSKIEDHRGIKIEDGIISIHFEFEIPAPIVNTPLWREPIISRGSGGRYTTNSVSRRILPGETNYNPFGNTTVDSYVNSTDVFAPLNDTGITVEGSKSNQSFGTTLWRGTLGVPEVLNIKLLGETEQNKSVREPVTVKTKLKCKTCGTMNSATSKFCSECGTSLEII